MNRLLQSSQQRSPKMLFDNPTRHITNRPLRAKSNICIYQIKLSNKHSVTTHTNVRLSFTVNKLARLCPQVNPRTEFNRIYTAITFIDRQTYIRYNRFWCYLKYGRRLVLFQRTVTSVQIEISYEKSLLEVLAYAHHQ